MQGVILNADCRLALKEMPDACVDMCLTSPPYWAQRDYGVDGQLGWEPTPDEYVAHLCDVFDEVKRVLRPTGTCWVNLGDTYGHGGTSAKRGLPGNGRPNDGIPAGGKSLRPKCLAQIPSRFALEMTNRGWILRNEIIWQKPNCVPSSVKDRFTVDFEKVFLFSRANTYYFDQQYEPLAAASIERARHPWHCERANNGQGVQLPAMGERFCPPAGRNMRCVWSISTSRFSGPHFATYPERLCETPIKAGCPEFVCRRCGKPRHKVREKVRNVAQDDRVLSKRAKKCGDRFQEVNTAPSVDLIEQYRVTGLTSCDCHAGFFAGVVLDPFAGAGTTLVVAKRLGRYYVGCELNPEYCRIADGRLKEGTPYPLSSPEASEGEGVTVGTF